MNAADRIDPHDADQLYTRYVEPLERDHRGEYAAVTPDGRIVIGPTLLETVEQATSTLGSRNVVFKIGERVVGKWLCLRIG